MADGTVTTAQQVLPVPAGTEVPAASISGTGDPGLDGTRAPFTFLKDQSKPGATVPLLGLAQDGTDSTDSQATQATAGVGIRGWLSTLVSLFRAGTAKVTINGTPTVSLSGTTTVAGTVTANVGTVATLAQDGTDSTAPTAVQATAGVGLRGWLSTLVSQYRANTAALANVSSSASSVVLVAANAGRKGLFIVNDSTAPLYLAYAGTASTTAYTFYVPGSVGGVPYVWEMSRPVFTGAIAGIWSSATGAARTTDVS